MRYVQYAWKSSNRKTSWGFVHANMPFIESASSSGWRWGKCARCATCPSCSSPSRPAAQTRLCQYSSLCPASRTWCSRLQPSLTVHYRHTQTHIPTLVLSPVQVHFGMSLWTHRRNWSYCADTHETCESAAIVTSLIFALVHKRIFWYQFWLMINCCHVFFFFFFSRTMKKSWSRRSFLLGRDVVDNFFTTKALFWGHQLKTRRKKKHKSQELQYTKIYFFL